MRACLDPPLLSSLTASNAPPSPVWCAPIPHRRSSRGAAHRPGLRGGPRRHRRGPARAPAPTITSPLSAIAVIGRPFSYQILATNFPSGFNALNLSGPVGVNTATGLISGTPASADTFSVSLSATNPGGTGNASLSLQVQADADGDGMGDAWETANGLNPAVNDSALDRDGDGQSNLAEWLAGTLPNNPVSRFAFTNEQAVGANISLTWTSAIGRRYRVFTRPVLNTGAWSEITTAPITATSAITTFVHVGGAAGAQRFYRVNIEP